MNCTFSFSFCRAVAHCFHLWLVSASTFSNCREQRIPASSKMICQTPIEPLNNWQQFH
jgi:hypothetical protein